MGTDIERHAHTFNQQGYCKVCLVSHHNVVIDKITHLMGFTDEETNEILKDQRAEEAMQKRICRRKNDPNMTAKIFSDKPANPEDYLPKQPAPQHTPTPDMTKTGIFPWTKDEQGFIVKAVKAYSSDQKKIKALVEAAKELLANMADSGADTNEETGEIYPDIAKLDNAIQQAGE